VFPDRHAERFSRDRGDSLQTSRRGRYYLCETGQGSFLGGLNSAISRKHFRLTKRTMNGRFWFFHHDCWMADNEVEVEIPCGVYECDVLHNSHFDDINWN
jgi:hypothetical protein